MTREELRVNALKQIKKHNNLIIEAATGSGKSFTALKVLQSIKARKVLILVAEVEHIKTWSNEMDKWKIKFPEISIYCYASLKKCVNIEYDAIIFDEAHHLNTKIRLEYFNDLNSSYKLFLSATLKSSFINYLEGYLKDVARLSLGLKEAIESNVLPEPKIFLIPQVLDNKEVTETVIEEWGKKDKRIKLTCAYRDRWKYIRSKKTIPNCTLTITCTKQQKYDYLSEKCDYYKRIYMASRRDITKTIWLKYGSLRKRYLGTLKENIAKSVIEKVNNKRLICFCTNIEQANSLGGNCAIHSKVSNKNDVINNFNIGETNQLFAVGMLQEGVNLDNIEVGIIIQLDGEERAFIQKFGRVLRSDSPEQYIIYYKNTRDEDYLNNALENIDRKYVKEISL